MFAALALAGSVAAYANSTTTVEETDYVTIPCPTPTTFAYGGSTYTVTSATTLTVKNCGCTDVAPSVAPVPANSTAPALVNGAAAGKIGAAAGVAAAVAYLL